MEYQSLEGKTIFGVNGAPYKLFKYVHDTSDEYRLPIFSGENTRDGSKITAIAFDIKDQSKLHNRLSLYKTKSDLKLIDTATSGQVNFIIFNVLPLDFEDIFYNSSSENSLPSVIEKTDISESLQKVEKNIKSTSSDPYPIQKRLQYPTIILMVFFCAAIFGGGFFLGRYFELPSMGITETFTVTQSSSLPLITPSTPDILIPTELITLIPEQTFTPITTDTSLPSNTPIATGTQLTLTPSGTPTITSVPFRDGLPGEIKLKVIKKGNIRSVPNTTSDNTILGKLEVGQSFWFRKAQLRDGNRIWLQIGPDQWISWLDNSGQRQTLHLDDGWVAYTDLLEKNNELVLNLPSITLTPTLTITLTP